MKEKNIIVGRNLKFDLFRKSSLRSQTKEWCSVNIALQLILKLKISKHSPLLYSDWFSESAGQEAKPQDLKKEETEMSMII